MKILITGTAGFIGFHLTKRLLSEGHKIVGIDNINNYYDTNLKYARLAETGISREAEAWNKEIQSSKFEHYKFIRLTLEDKEAIDKLFAEEKFDYVVNLAAQAGVRYSIENPDAYIQSNVVGFTNILEACRHNPVKHLIYASSSSVYGANAKIPFSETDRVDHPVSLYAATKKSNELLAHTYSHLYNLPTTGLRFFTVYGPWGRPDMAPILFASAINENRPIKVFNKGDMERDFTYIDDIIEGIIRVLNKTPKMAVNFPKNNYSNSAFSPHKGGDADVRHGGGWQKGSDKKYTTSVRKSEDEIISAQNETTKKEIGEAELYYRVLNIGNGSPVNLLKFIETMEKAMGKKAKKIMMPIQPGDVKQTWADTKALEEITGYRPQVDIENGVEKFVQWFKEYYAKE